MAPTAPTTGYDRFGRVVGRPWDGYDEGNRNGAADVDQFKYGHDYACNRLYRDSTQAGKDQISSGFRGHEPIKGV